MKKTQRFSDILKITKIDIYAFDIPLREVFQIATMNISVASNVLIHIQTNSEIDGWGEGSPFHAIVGETQSINFAAAKELKSLILGKNPLEINSLIRLMDVHLPHNQTIKSAFDMALHDIAAKYAGLPLYRYLGGEKRVIETDMTIGICPLEAVERKAKEIVSMGFRIIKVKLGLDAKSDYLRLKLIREAVGPEVRIRIDANQGWDRVSALRNLAHFNQFNIEFCEQPCKAHDLSGMKYVSERTNIPIMADESLFSPSHALDLVVDDITPYFNIKLSKSGGINNATKIAHIAESGIRPSMVGCMSESRLGLTAAAHFGLSHSIITFFDLDSNLEHAEDYIRGGIVIHDGFIQVPDEPGIGAYPDPEYINHLEEI